MARLVSSRLAMPTLKLCSFIGLAALTLGCSEDRVAPDADEDAALVERGRYLVENVAACSNCHTPRDAKGALIPELALSGVDCFIPGPNGECLNVSNLTNHETGLLQRTDDEIKRMIRDGVRPGPGGDEPLFSEMPSFVFHNTTDHDLDAEIAYLRTVPGVDHAVAPSGPSFVLAAPVNPVDLSALPEPIAGVADPEAVLRGRYLAAQAGQCVGCHTKHLDGNPNFLDYSGFFLGGQTFPLPLPTLPISTNLTPDVETGLGSWSLQEVVVAVKQGNDKRGDGLCPPMPFGPQEGYAGITDEDALDIAQYLASLPAVVHAIDDQCTFPPPPTVEPALGTP
jgi:mono/diheme cytochrome c family protein